MSAPETMEKLAPELRGTARMIQQTFPAGVPESAYNPLLVLLYESMSFRAVARVVEFCTGRPWPVVYNDVLGAVAQADAGKLDPQALEDTRLALRLHGYDEWLAQEP